MSTPKTTRAKGPLTNAERAEFLLGVSWEVAAIADLIEDSIGKINFPAGGESGELGLKMALRQLKAVASAGMDACDRNLDDRTNIAETLLTAPASFDGGVFADTEEANG